MPLVENVPRALVIATFFALQVACADLKRAEPEGDAAAPTDASTDAANQGDANVADASIPDGNGPGPHGSLPTGYCCASDTECRDRHCVQIGGFGGKMCLDECTQDTRCQRPDFFSFVCEASGSPRLCRPEITFACLDPAKFTRGTRGLGACCNVPVVNPDGTAGLECEGSLCTRLGGAPLVCTHRCASQADCPGDYGCLLEGNSNACVPGATDYTCR